MKRSVSAVVCLVGLLGLSVPFSPATGVSGAAWAQDAYPVKPVRMVVPFGAGGATHTLARLFAEEMSKELGQKVVVTAVPGSGGAIGAAQVARARPDGYTIAMGANSTMGLRWQASETGYTLDSFIPLGAIAALPTGWAVRTDSPIRTMKDLAEHIRTKPGVNYASVGAGSPGHIATEGWAETGNLKVTHVATRGGKEAIVKLLSGEVTFIAIAGNNFPGQRSNGQEGQFRGIAITTAYPFTSEIPTMASLGYDSTDVTWWGPFAPAATPDAIVEKLAAAVAKAAQSDNFRQALKKFYFVSNYLGPEDAARDIRSYSQRMGEALKKLGMHKSQQAR